MLDAVKIAELFEKSYQQFIDLSVHAMNKNNRRK